MDQEKGNPWRQSPDAKKHPYDSPLTTQGHTTASEPADGTQTTF